MDKWVARRVRAYQAKHWRNTLWRRHPDQYLHGALGLTCLYTLRRDFLRELAARRLPGNRPVERSSGKVRYAIRLPANDVLMRQIEDLLTRPCRRPSHAPPVRYRSFSIRPRPGIGLGG
jgi:hypothetical protein